MCELPSHLIEIARDELGEIDVDYRNEKLKELRQAIENLTEEDRIKDLADANLIRFLRTNKFNIDEAIQSTVKYKKFYNSYGDILSNLKGEEFTEMSNFFQILPSQDEKGRVIVLLRPKLAVQNMSNEKLALNPRILLRFNVWLFELLSRDVHVQVAGLVILNTFKDVTFMESMRLQSMASISDRIASFQFLHILGLRLSKALIFEQPSFVTWLFAIMKPFMSVKMQVRFHLCGNNYDALQEVTGGNMSILPKVLGGEQEDSISSSAGSFNWIELQQQLEAIES